MSKNKYLSPKSVARFFVAPLALAVLAACGGGGSDDDDEEPVTVSVMTGTVAEGAYINGAKIDVTCKAGGSVESATTDANGAFSVTLSDDSERPCVIVATKPDGGKLRSVVPGGNPNPTHVNISTMTDLFVSYVVGQTHGVDSANVDITALIKQDGDLFTQVVNNSQALGNSKGNFESYLQTEYGVSVAGFDFLTSPIVLGQPTDNVLEALLDVQVDVTAPDGTVTQVPLIGANGLPNAVAVEELKADAPAITSSDIPACTATTCGGDAGEEIVITGGNS